MEIRTIGPARVGEPEFDTTANKGTPVAKFGVAENFEDRDGNEITVWTNCKAYGYLAKMIANANAKGRRVIVNGEMNYWEYQGEQYSEMRVNNIRFLDAKDQNNGGGGGAFDQSQNGQSNAFDQSQPQQQQPAQQSAGGGGGETFEPDDELPF